MITNIKNEIPANWTAPQLKFCAIIKNGSDPTTAGDVPVYGSGQEIVKYCGEYKIGPAILLGRKGTLNKPRLVMDRFWNVDTAMDMYPKDNISIQFLYYLTTVFDVERYSTNTARPSMTQGSYYGMHIPLPSLNNQKDICNYLDSVNDSIIKKLDLFNNTIELLQEYKKSLISNGVTKGLFESTPLVDTKNIWFPAIPTHWKMIKLKYLFAINKRIAGEEGHAVLSITQRGIVPKDLSKNEGQIAQSYANYQIVHKGDFAMNHMDLLTGWVDISQYKGVTSPDYRVFTLNDTKNNNPKYFLYIMQMCYFNRIFYNMGAGVSELGRWRLQATPFREFKVPVPPIDEQNEIVKFLDEKCTKADEAIKRQEMAIEKLEEYRKSIIYHAITGKIDCRKEKENE